MAWTNALDNATPLGSQAPPVLDDHIRLIKAALQERLNADHYWPLTGTAVSDTDAGKHRKITLQAVLGTKPTLLTGEAALYSKTVSGASEAFIEDSAGNEVQLTSGGALNVLIAQIQGILTNDTYFTAIDNAGTGTTNLIKAGQNEAADTDVAILPDKTRLATSAAPLEDTALANKKYVDDTIPTLGTRTNDDEDTVALTKDTVYNATGDGYLVAYAASGGAIAMYSSGVNPPTTIIDRHEVAANDYGGMLNVHGLIKSGDYVKITATGSITANWIPFGSGVLT